MAETGENTAEIRAHEQTFHGFMVMVKWGTAVVALIAALVVFLIAS